MTSPCQEVRGRLSALIDGEVPPAEAVELESHLEGCEPCRKERLELLATRRRLATAFKGMQQEAPQPPDLRKPLFPRRLTAFLGTAAVVLVVVGLLLILPQERAEALSPSEVVERAMAHHRSMKDAELSWKLESQALRILTALFSDEDRSKVVLRGRLWIKAPDRFLMRAEKPGEEEEPEVLMGFDGESLWVHDAKKNTVRRVGRKSLDASEAAGMLKDAADLDMGLGPFSEGTIMKLLSWEGIVSFTRSQEGMVIREITTPTQRRVGLRSFRIPLPIKKEGEEEETEKGSGSSSRFEERVKRHLAHDVTVTIDPERDLVEKLVYHLRLAELGILRVTVSLVRSDQGLPDSMFRAAMQVPPGTDLGDR